MVYIVWLTGAVTAVMGIAVLFKPLWLRQMLTVVNKGKFIYAAAMSKSVLGILFLIMARECIHPKVIVAVGILMTFGPILFCLLPFAKIQAYLNWWFARPVWLYRVWAAAAALLGGFIMYAGVPQ